MPVIGRLDEQVNDVIISPISHRRDEELLVNPHEETNTRRRSRERAPTQTPPAGESSAKADELPVWLL
ncbi:MAG: hypothetical protein QOC61_2369 [Acidobacteriota bacterium]|jgi:hypothetical protein|nr:hypothetical protein [Acidobacteriota bacterium]